MAATVCGGQTGGHGGTQVLIPQKTTISAVHLAEYLQLALQLMIDQNANRTLHSPSIHGTANAEENQGPSEGTRVLHPRKDAGLVFTMDDTFRDLADKVRKVSGLSDFLFHGVRHLFESQAAELPDDRDRALIPPYLRDMLLDHAPKRGSGAGYDHSSYVCEMRAALEIRADYVTKQIEELSI